MPFSLDDAIDLHGKQLNAFLDMAPVYDPEDLASQFRERIRASYDPFEHFLHVRGFWGRKWAEAADSSENINRFDIKNEGLRIFLAAVWAMAGKDFSHSHTIYAALPDPRDLEAYDFLLRIRSFVHSRRSRSGRANLIGDHSEDLLEFEDFLSFGDMLGPDADERERFEFGNTVRARLLASRRRISRFAKGVFGRELSQGVRIAPDSPIRFGSGGLFCEVPAQEAAEVERSRDALNLLLTSQHYSVPIDDSELQNTFHNAGDWITRVPELASLFYDLDGSLARSLNFLCQIDGVGERLFPGYALFEVSLDERVMKESESLRGKLFRRKLERLETLLAGPDLGSRRRHLTPDLALPCSRRSTPRWKLHAGSGPDRRHSVGPRNQEAPAHGQRPAHEKRRDGQSLPAIVFGFFRDSRLRTISGPSSRKPVSPKTRSSWSSSWLPTVEPSNSTQTPASSTRTRSQSLKLSAATRAD